jgi:thiol-disulfide isomerase/thioredoxin
MANNSRTGKQSSRKKLSTSNIVVVVVSAVAVLAVISIISSQKSSNNSSDTSVTPTLPTFPHGQLPAAESQPVGVQGEALPELPDSGQDPAIGMKAPLLSGFNFDGSPVSLTPGADGNATMVVFLAHWCPHCNREVPVLIDWKELGLVPNTLTVIGITTGTRSDYPNYPPSQWITAIKWPWASFPDSANADAALAYGVAGYPTFVVIDKNGYVRYRGSGEKTVEEVDSAVRTALSIA